ncbi:hypothetical protein SAM40697_2216 [Streptomyces ambofaciens]|uniref:Secreted protein n=1 Tax=Streptomyces ambofaciens TaxID=1889 RepID=A0ABM6AXU6_STRAM|nr:hypothetical protein [Streptomyces ambofaciens]ANB06176.1 hypothetical protein SAM40697_2216 [Streptomyces ambofaciens]
MSDVTRQPGGIPVERDRQTPDARGETALGTTPPHEADPAPGARADHAAGTRGETTPGLRTDGGPGHTSDLRSDNPGLPTDPGHTSDLRSDNPGHTSGLPTDPGHTSGLRSDNPEHISGLRTDNPEHASARSARGDGALLPHDELDKLGQRLQHAVAGFVDAPRASVEEADRVLEEIAARFTDAVTHRRKTLRTSWHDTGADDRATSTDTEQLRLALRDYRELADRLMHL